MYRRLFAAAFMPLSLALFATVATSATFRRDVVEGFGKIACDPSGPSAAKAWAAGIYDAQVEGRKLEPLAGQAVSSDDALRKGKTLAKIRGFGGYAGGLCADGSGWAAAFPAAAPLGRLDAKGRMQLPQQALKHQCESFRVDYAARDTGAPRELLDVVALPLDHLAVGSISVTCQPKSPRWQGPVLWFLLPVGDGPGAVPPEADALVSGADPTASLTTWLNRVRVKEGLLPLESLATLAAEAGVLAVDGDLSHNRELLRKVAGQLAADKLKLIGEDRVRATDAVQMAWLLWNSPRHRGLLLNKEASAVGIALRQLGPEQLAVLITAAKTPLNTATKAAKKKKG